ncbi:hypothetical protein [Pseudoxanthomonas wuyuanensis]
MKPMLTRTALTLAILTMGACGNAPDTDAGTAGTTSGRVEASGKRQQDIAGVPAEVLAAATTARPRLQVTGAEHEQRDGNDYYDVAGTVDGNEIELDITRIDGQWSVVEIQRDIAAAQVPAAVAAALAQAHPAFEAVRIIESDQGDGIVIYEFFDPGNDGKDTKMEVKYDGASAEVLTSEWIH